MILTQEALNFLGKNRAARQERKATRKQIRQERKKVRKEARQLRRSGDKTGAKALRKNFRATAKNLRREKGMGLLGALGMGIKKPRASSDLAEQPQNAQTQNNEAQEQNLNAGALAATSQVTTQFSEPRTTGGSSDTSGSSFPSKSGSSQDEGQDSSKEDEGADENNSEKTNKKSPKWLWIGGGLVLLVIAVVLFLVLKNKE